MNQENKVDEGSNRVLASDKNDLYDSKDEQPEQEAIKAKGVSALSNQLDEIEDAYPLNLADIQKRLDELQQPPTKEEIDALIAQYSDQSDDSSLFSDNESSDEENISQHRLNTNSTEQETVIMKVLVVGNARCGKTSTIRRYVKKDFSEEYVSTIGADFIENVLRYDDQLTISLQLWDIAGQDRFAKLTRAYFKEAKGALIVCDITRENTIDAVVTWKKEIDICCQDLNCGQNIPVVLVANKSDLLDNPMGALDIGVNMQKCVHANGILEWFRTSAKNGDHVDDAFQCLIDQMVINYRKDRLLATQQTYESENHGHEICEAKGDIIRLNDFHFDQAMTKTIEGLPVCNCN